VGGHGQQPGAVRGPAAASITCPTPTTWRATPSRGGQPEHGAELADDLERIVALHDASTIAAVIVEPVAGSAGVLPRPRAICERLREICDKHGILLIFDEVITGFGRLGAPSPPSASASRPDMMTMAKGLTNAAVPMGAVAASRKIHDALMEGAEHPIEFFHGYTYSGHPLACAAGIAALDLYRDEALFARAASTRESSFASPATSSPSLRP
jgi:beta-alanine--pyruvate transaminase